MSTAAESVSRSDGPGVTDTPCQTSISLNSSIKPRKPASGTHYQLEINKFMTVLRSNLTNLYHNKSINFYLVLPLIHHLWRSPGTQLFPCTYKTKWIIQERTEQYVLSYKYIQTSWNFFWLSIKADLWRSVLWNGNTTLNLCLDVQWWTCTLCILQWVYLWGGRRGLTNTDPWSSCQGFSVMFVFSNALTHNLHFALSHQPSENIQP